MFTSDMLSVRLRQLYKFFTVRFGAKWATHLSRMPGVSRKRVIDLFDCANGRGENLNVALLDRLENMAFSIGFVYSGKLSDGRLLSRTGELCHVCGELAPSSVKNISGTTAIDMPGLLKLQKLYQSKYSSQARYLKKYLDRQEKQSSKEYRRIFKIAQNYLATYGKPKNGDVTPRARGEAIPLSNSYHQKRFFGMALEELRKHFSSALLLTQNGQPFPEEQDPVFGIKLKDSGESELQ